MWLCESTYVWSETFFSVPVLEANKIVEITAKKSLQNDKYYPANIKLHYFLQPLTLPLH